MSSILDKAQNIAIAAAKEAGLYCLNHFNNKNSLKSKGIYGDIVTEVDKVAESLIINRITASFPNHSIYGEEIGSIKKDPDWVWQIDPLDGTNNYVIGLPVFSTSITLIHKNQPVLGVIYEPITNKLYHACSNKGSYLNNQRFFIKCVNNANFNLGWIQGHKVQNDPKAKTLRETLESNSKRVMRLWAPTIQWCMLAKGDIDGIVLYNSESEDLYSGLILVKEAGGTIIDFKGNEVIEIVDTPYLIAAHPNNISKIQELVRSGLG